MAVGGTESVFSCGDSVWEQSIINGENTHNNNTNIDFEVFCPVPFGGPHRDQELGRKAEKKKKLRKVFFGDSGSPNNQSYIMFP